MGLGNAATVQSLKWQFKHKSPQLVFIMETKLVRSELDFLVKMLGFYNFWSVDCDATNGGTRGGLLLLWESKLDVRIISSDHLFLIRNEFCYLTI